MNIINFTNSICHIPINIRIERELYEKEYIFFDSVLKEFCEVKQSTDKFLLIYYYATPPNDTNNAYYCDFKNQWIFDILTAIESYIINTINTTVFHGSSVLYKNCTYILLGDRMQGKTTLTDYFVNEKNASLIDDDCVYYVNNMIYGFCLPLRKRDKPILNSSLICEFTDEIKQKRYLISAQKRRCMGNENIVVIFPKYNKFCNNIKVLKGKELFIKLLHTTRHSNNNNELFSDISYICNNVPAFEILYDHCDRVFDMINA